MAFWGRETVEEFIGLVKKGFTYGCIAKKMNLSRNAVLGKARRMGFSKPTQPKIVALPPVKLQLKDMRLISIMNLTESDCKYPVESNDGFLFCGLPRVRGAYCAGHAKICYIPPKPG
jgi:GcrA cell cycle regulator